MVVKYAATVVYLRNHFFPQFIQNSRSHSNVYNNLIFSKKKPHQLNRKVTDGSTENMYGITGVHQNYENRDCSDRIA